MKKDDLKDGTLLRYKGTASCLNYGGHYTVREEMGHMCIQCREGAHTIEESLNEYDICDGTEGPLPENSGDHFGVIFRGFDNSRGDTDMFRRRLRVSSFSPEAVIQAVIKDLNNIIGAEDAAMVVTLACGITGDTMWGVSEIHVPAEKRPANFPYPESCVSTWQAEREVTKPGIEEFFERMGFKVQRGQIR